MTTNPITPPRELVRQWLDEYYEPPAPSRMAPGEATLHIATQAARWGADQELEAVCELLDGFSVVPLDHSANLPSNRLAARDRVTRLRAARRPKPPSLKEQALQAWAAVEAGTDDQAAMAVIRRALNELPDE